MVISVKYNTPSYNELFTDYKVNYMAFTFDTPTLKKTKKPKFITPYDEEFISKLNNILQNHKTLAPKLFSPDNQLLPEIRNKLLTIFENIRKRFLIFFPQFKIIDVQITGSICGYIYSQDSDIDIFIILDGIFPEKTYFSDKIFRKLNLLLSVIGFKPSIHGYVVDIGLLSPSARQVTSRNRYSLLQNKWMEEPVYQDFAFNHEYLRSAYIREYNKLINYVNNLPKKNNELLTYESALKLKDYLTNICNKAFDANKYFKAHEYCLEYNVYRLLKHCYVYGYYRKMSEQSLNQI